MRQLRRPGVAALSRTVDENKRTLGKERMSDKRANSALWKMEIEEDEEPGDQPTAIVYRYKQVSRKDPSKYPAFQEVELSQPFDDVELTLYLRVRRGWGIHSFVGPYLVNDADRSKFRVRSVDACLFIATTKSLFAVTYGSGHRLIEDHADYGFPFDTAKKLLANNFTAADMRSFTGSTTSRTETYRRGQSIESSESFGKVWKRLVGRLNGTLLPKDSYLGKLIDPTRPPTIEVKSSFVLRKGLDLRQLVLLAREVESLPDPTEEQLRQLSFLDNLYPVRSTSLRAELKHQFVENLRRAVNADFDFDFDVCDPDDIARYYTGSGFKLSHWNLAGDPPDTEDVIDALRSNLREFLGNTSLFAEKLDSLYLHYATTADDDAPRVHKELYKFMHGQVAHEGQTYFLLDKIWYRVQGDFLANLKKDFIEEVFHSARPILTKPSELPFTLWSDKDEDAFNKRQAREDGFYFGDKIYAISNRGKVELFDLLKVDEQNGILYVIHVKDGFDAKMRDACSQISIAAEVIRRDISSDMAMLKAYYQDWGQDPINADKDVSQETFVKWFASSEIVYVVLASTAADFSAASFEDDTLHSHIARREILATRNELKSHNQVFKLSHTKREKPRSREPS